MSGKELEFLEAFNTKVSRISPSEFAEQNRYLGTGESRWSGPYRFDLTPYLREVVDCLMPDVPVTRIAVMKGAQIGFSTGVIENGIPWIISQNPANILLMAADDELVKVAMTQKIDPAIDSCGIRHLIGAHTGVNKKKNQRTGDTEKGKEFHGGRLIATSVRSAHKMRQFSAKYGFLDDLDSAKTADEREGSLIKLVDGRFTTFGDTAKIFYISTPVTKQTSVIEPLFLKGDQRYFQLPCPHCGGFQRLEWSVDVAKTVRKNGKAGIIYEQDDTGMVIPESVGYICKHCGTFIDEKHKYEMNLNGFWEPSEKPKAANFRSYHISGLYAPPGAYSWAQFAQDWCDIWPKENGGKPIIHLLKTFKNTCLGQTYEERGRSIDPINLALNTRNEYKPGIVPMKLSQEDGNGRIVMLTCACDLNGTTDDARLDYQVVAWSETGTSYSIDHGSIGSYQGRKSKPDDEREILTYRNEAANSVWKEFFRIIQQDWTTDEGGIMRIMVSGVDTGYHTNFAYEFMKLSPFILGLKGQEDNKFTAFDVATPTFKEAEIPQLYMLQVNRMKDVLSERIDLKWMDRQGQQPAGFMNFPQPTDGKYTMEFFTHYAAERRDVKLNDDGTAVAARWVKKHSTAQNHFWDTDLYNRAVRDIFVDLFCKTEGIKKPSWHTFVSLIIPR